MPLSTLFSRTPRPWTTRRIPINGRRLRVLVVDDDHSAALALSTYLSLEGIECCPVFGGREAIDMGHGWSPHVILMDISMPQCDGIEAARALRDDSRTSGIAIIAHSALDETEVRHRLGNDEFDGYLQKGRPLSQLIALVTTLAH